METRSTPLRNEFGVDGMHVPMSASTRPDAALELEIEAASTPDSVYLFVTPTAANDLKEVLKRSSVGFASAAFAGPDSYLTAITAILGTGGLAALTPVLVAFVQRHKDKMVRIRLGNQEALIQGYSGRETERLLQTLTQMGSQDPASLNQSSENEGDNPRNTRTELE